LRKLLLKAAHLKEPDCRNEYIKTIILCEQIQAHGSALDEDTTLSITRRVTAALSLSPNDPPLARKIALMEAQSVMVASLDRLNIPSDPLCTSVLQATLRASIERIQPKLNRALTPGSCGSSTTVPKTVQDEIKVRVTMCASVNELGAGRSLTIGELRHEDSIQVLFISEKPPPLNLRLYRREHDRSRNHWTRSNLLLPVVGFHEKIGNLPPLPEGSLHEIFVVDRSNSYIVAVLGQSPASPADEQPDVGIILDLQGNLDAVVAQRLEGRKPAVVHSYVVNGQSQATLGEWSENAIPGIEPYCANVYVVTM